MMGIGRAVCRQRKSWKTLTATRITCWQFLHHKFRYAFIVFVIRSHFLTFFSPNFHCYSYLYVRIPTRLITYSDLHCQAKEAATHTAAASIHVGFAKCVEFIVLFDLMRGSGFRDSDLRASFVIRYSTLYIRHSSQNS